MKFSLVNLGCKVNRVESDTIIAQMEARGHVHDDEGAQAVVVNTCTVTGEAGQEGPQGRPPSAHDHPGAHP